jgi:hypothetical protein
MDDDLVTVATFWSPIEANLAKNQLEAAGVPVAMADEMTAVVNWGLTNAIRGIKLQVRRRDFERAEAALADSHKVPAEEIDTAWAEAGTPDEVEEAATQQSDAATPDEPEPHLNERQQLADRALRGAILGLAFWPLQLWVFGLLWRVYLSDEPLGAKARRSALVAAAITVPVVFAFLLVGRAMIAR